MSASHALASSACFAAAGLLFAAAEEVRRPIRGLGDPGEAAPTPATP